MGEYEAQSMDGQDWFSVLSIPGTIYLNFLFIQYIFNSPSTAGVIGFLVNLGLLANFITAYSEEGVYSEIANRWELCDESSNDNRIYIIRDLFCKLGYALFVSILIGGFVYGFFEFGISGGADYDMPPRA